MSKGEIQYFITFAAGMAVFWLSGVVSAHLPILSNHFLAQTAALLTAAAVYGFGMLLLSLGLYGSRRSTKAVLIATLVAVVLALVGAQVLVRLAAPFVHNKFDFGIFNFVAYFIYGLFYVVSAWAGRRVLH